MDVVYMRKPDFGGACIGREKNPRSVFDRVFEVNLHKHSLSVSFKSKVGCNCGRKMITSHCSTCMWTCRADRAAPISRSAVGSRPSASYIKVTQMQYVMRTKLGSSTRNAVYSSLLFRLRVLAPTMEL